MKTTIPCETCISKAMCKYKPYIKCSLLLETYNMINNGPFPADRMLEMLLCGLFNWEYDLTYVEKLHDCIEIVTPAINMD